ncbi:MAG: SDR family oxidoreductase [Lacunisphaera sp.]
MNNGFSLNGKTALITGGTRGIGRAISLRFARAGVRVIANYVRDTGAAESLQKEATAEGLDLQIVRADITTEKGVQRLLTEVETRFSPLSILVHCAATGVHRPLEQLTMRHYDWTFALNVRSFFELVQQLLPKFSSDSAIVAVSSEGATRAVPQYTLVGSSKGALESMARHLAVELAPRGIRVNILAPGSIETDAWHALPDAASRLTEAKKRSPLGRLTQLDEVAQAAQFLCSSAASGVIGHTLVVDGGYRIRE